VLLKFLAANTHKTQIVGKRKNSFILMCFSPALLMSMFEYSILLHFYHTLADSKTKFSLICNWKRVDWFLFDISRKCVKRFWKIFLLLPLPGKFLLQKFLNAFAFAFILQSGDLFAPPASRHARIIKVF